MPNSDTRFKPGDPRINRLGRPRGQALSATIRDAFRRAGEELIEIDGVTRTREEAILDNITTGAAKGDPVKQKYFLEYRFGKPVQAVEAEVNLSNLSDRELLERVQRTYEAIRFEIEGSSDLTKEEETDEE